MSTTYLSGIFYGQLYFYHIFGLTWSRRLLAQHDVNIAILKAP